METWRYENTETWRHGHGEMEASKRKQKTEAQAIFLDLFTVRSLCKWMFVVCPFVEEANGSYPFIIRALRTMLLQCFRKVTPFR